MTNSTDAAFDREGCRGKPLAHELPGLAEARAYLDRETGSPDPLAVEATDWPDPEPLRMTPDVAFDALMILRLGRVLMESGVEIPPAPGCVVALMMSQKTDRARAAKCLSEFIRSDQGGSMRIAVEKDGQKDGGSTFETYMQSALLDGYPVVAICARTDRLPAELAPLVEAQLRVPLPDAAMIGAVLMLLHPEQAVEVDVPDNEIARLSPIQLLPVVAAPDAAQALAVLRRMCAAQTLETGQTTLADVHGQPLAVAALEQVVCDLEHWRAGKVAWPEIVHSFLLTGPPGTGKTLLAKALAGSARVPLIKTSYSDCQRHGHQGDMLAALHRAAEQAMHLAPSVFFIDEIDSFFGRDRPGNGYIIGVVNGLLTLIDQLFTTPGVVLVAATNDDRRVDPAVIRAGRFDRHIRVGPPDRAGIRGMLQANLPEGLLSDAQLADLADQLLGLTGAAIAALLRDARTRARVARRPLSAADVAAAADARACLVNRETLWRVSVHEAGHLLIGHLLSLAPPVLVRVTAMGGQVVRPYPQLLNRSDVHAWLRNYLAGRAAESVVFGEISSGAGGGEDSDLAKATRLSVEAEGTLGFGPTLTWMPCDLTQPFLPRAVRDRVEAALQEAAADATARLTRHRPALEHIARVLLDRREMDGPALAALMADAVPAPDPGGESLLSQTGPDAPHAG